MWQGWVSIFLGVWLAVAPFSPLDVPWIMLNNIFVGVAAVLASGSIPIKKVKLSWLGVAAGTWVVLSTYFRIFVTGEGYLWNNIISGVFILMAGSLALVSSPSWRNAR